MEQRALSHILTACLWATMLVQSGLGLLFADQYRDVPWITATWYGNDWATLLVAEPLLLVALVLARHGSVRGRLLWLGLLGYAAYNYAFYLFGAALNAFFPLYVIALVLSVLALISSLSGLDVAAVAASVQPNTPVRVIGGFLALIGVGLASVWLVMWAGYAFAGRPTPVEPEAFKLVAALDLSIMTTALTIGGVLLWQRHAWGYVLAAIAGSQASLYLFVLSINAIVAIRRGIVEFPGELPLWGTLGVLTTATTLLLLTNVSGQFPRR